MEWKSTNLSGLVISVVYNEVHQTYDLYIFTEVINCPSLTPPTDGVITFTPGADNSNIGLGSVVTYSCNLGYVLVGQTTRECQSVFGGATAGWTGYSPVCQGRFETVDN